MHEAARLGGRCRTIPRGLDSRLASAVYSQLPRGGELPVEEWERRHRALTRLLWATAVVVAAYSALQGYAAWHTALDASAVVVAALVAGRSELGRRARSLACSFGLLTACRDGRARVRRRHRGPLLLLRRRRAAHAVRGLDGVRAGGPVHAAASRRARHVRPRGGLRRPSGSPWEWAAIHAVFVAAAGAAGVVAWRLNEDVRHRMRETQDELRDAAMTDSLTGLPNRRRLTDDLETAVDDGRRRASRCSTSTASRATTTPSATSPATPCSPASATGCARPWATRGTAYRLGGDEFCVLAGGATSAATIEAAAEALAERGGAFTIGNSHGTVILGDEVRKPEDALRIADQRMYERRTAAAGRPATRARPCSSGPCPSGTPTSRSHSADVSRMAELVARRARRGRGPAGADPPCGRAARRRQGRHPGRDPRKPGALDAEEWAFMRRHTIIGERIVAGAPALAQVGRLVRSSHERWDGTGYPDELDGEAIPIGSRIIAVCDASTRCGPSVPTRPGRRTSAALAELRRDAGTQFDPAVVEASARSWPTSSPLLPGLVAAPVPG